MANRTCKKDLGNRRQEFELGKTKDDVGACR